MCIYVKRKNKEKKMIRVVATFQLKQERIDEAIELAKELVVATREEKGCAQYDLAQSAREKKHLVMLEAWETSHDLDMHMASAHFNRLVPMLASLCTQPPVVESFEQLA